MSQQTEAGCDHDTITMVRALAAFARAYRLAQQRDAARHQAMSEAYALCPEICSEVAAGRQRRDDAVPMPGTAQWEDYLDRRTGTTRQWRAELLQPPTATRGERRDRSGTRARHRDSRRGSGSQISPQHTRRSRHPWRHPALGPYSHEDLAQKWAAVHGEVSTTVLADLLNVASTETKQYARAIGDMLEEPPWRIRVRRSLVQGADLQECCENILIHLEDNDL